LALGVASVAALIAVLVVLRQRDDREARANRLTARLVSFDDRKVAGLDVQVQGTTWRFVRAPTGWRIVSPVDDVADARAVEALLQAARRAPVVKTIHEPEALSSYGLAPPAARLTLVNVTVPTVELGNVAPTGDGVFARLDGRPEVVLLGLPDATPLTRLDAARWRERSIVDVARSEIEGLTLAPSDLQLMREADGWWILSPRRLPASTTGVDALLGAIYGAKVFGWDDAGSPADARYGLASADARTFTLRTGNASQTIALGGDAGDGRRYVASEGRKTILIAEVPPAALSSLDLASFRDTRLTNVNRYDVTRLVYASDGARFAATRKDETTWLTDAGKTVRAERVYTLLVGLLEAETVGVSDGTLGVRPSATLTYEKGAGGTAGALSFVGDRASWDALPGLVFRLAAPPPLVPE
jgi:hypothetical protein